jgi:hypothetical protein
MKILSAWAAGWIAFYIADNVLYGGRIVEALLKLARLAAAELGIHF